MLNLYLLCLATWRKDIKPQDVEEAINSAVPGKLMVKSVSGVKFCSGFWQNKTNIENEICYLYFDVALKFDLALKPENFVCLYLSLSLSMNTLNVLIGCYLL